MSRCRACDEIITNPYGRGKDKLLEDMCRRCISLSYDNTIEHEYVHGVLTEDPIRLLLESLYQENEDFD